MHTVICIFIFILDTISSHTSFGTSLFLSPRPLSEGEELVYDNDMYDTVWRKVGLGSEVYADDDDDDNDDEADDDSKEQGGEGLQSSRLCTAALSLKTLRDFLHNFDLY
jgi:hypothetical protein